jgi:hypothetical protein
MVKESVWFVYRLSTFLLLMALFLALLGLSPIKQRRIKMEAEELVSIWLNMVDRIKDDQFKEIDDISALPNLVRGNSLSWCSRFLKQNVNPYNPKLKVRHFFHLATEMSLDLLKHEYIAEKMSLVIIESRSFTLVRVAHSGVKLLELSNDERKNLIRHLAADILNPPDGKSEWTFLLPNTVGEKTLFSTNPQADPLTLSSWKQRVDGAVRHGELSLLMFKRSAGILGFHPAQDWFEEDFRKRHGGQVIRDEYE